MKEEKLVQPGERGTTAGVSVPEAPKRRSRTVVTLHRPFRHQTVHRTMRCHFFLSQKRDNESDTLQHTKTQQLCAPMSWIVNALVSHLTTCGKFLTALCLWSRRGGTPHRRHRNRWTSFSGTKLWRMCSCRISSWSEAHHESLETTVLGILLPSAGNADCDRCVESTRGKSVVKACIALEQCGPRTGRSTTALKMHCECSILATIGRILRRIWLRSMRHQSTRTL